MGSGVISLLPISFLRRLLVQPGEARGEETVGAKAVATSPPGLGKRFGLTENGLVGAPWRSGPGGPAACRAGHLQCHGTNRHCSPQPHLHAEIERIQRGWIRTGHRPAFRHRHQAL